MKIWRKVFKWIGYEFDIRKQAWLSIGNQSYTARIIEGDLKNYIAISQQEKGVQNDRVEG